jgi:putative Mn2+ efflux pump MntP
MPARRLGRTMGAETKEHAKGVAMTRKLFEYGGWIAGAVLIAFGVVAIYMGVNGRSEVRDALAEQKITATDDAAEITDGALQPGEPITTGAEAKEFANIMEFHALESTEGRRYAEMGRFLTESGEETNDEAAAAKDENGRPVENGLRNLWVTETALATALNMSYMAEQLALFGIVVGVALVLTGVGFLVLALGGALRRADATSAAVPRRETARATG